MYVWSTKRNLFTKFFSRMSVIFRGESNEISLTMIGYSDATVTTSNYLQIMRSNVSLATVPATVP